MLKKLAIGALATSLLFSATGSFGPSVLAGPACYNDYSFDAYLKSNQTKTSKTYAVCEGDIWVKVVASGSGASSSDAKLIIEVFDKDTSKKVESVTVKVNGNQDKKTEWSKIGRTYSTNNYYIKVTSPTKKDWTFDVTASLESR